VNKSKQPSDHFLNVDVELRSRTPMKALQEEFESLRASVLYHGKENRGWLLSFESGKFRRRKSPDRAVEDLCDLIGKLSPEGKKAWRKATSRVFDFGFEVAGNSRITDSLSKDSMEMIVALDATFALTCYGRTSAGSKKEA
jgi:hypothetical protein